MVVQDIEKFEIFFKIYPIPLTAVGRLIGSAHSADLTR